MPSRRRGASRFNPSRMCGPVRTSAASPPAVRCPLHPNRESALHPPPKPSHPSTRQLPLLAHGFPQVPPCARRIPGCRRRSACHPGSGVSVSGAQRYLLVGSSLSSTCSRYSDADFGFPTPAHGRPDFALRSTRGARLVSGTMRVPRVDCTAMSGRPRAGDGSQKSASV